MPTELSFSKLPKTPMKTSRFLFCALLAIGMAAGPDAHAALMYSGVRNVAIPFALPAGQDGVYVRLSDGITSTSYPGDIPWNTQPWLNPFFGGVDIANSPLLRPVITGTDQIVNLAFGTVIDSAGNFVAGESGSSLHVGAAANQFHIGTPGLMGFAFKTAPAGPDYYGWLRMSVNNVGDGNIVDWAYNDAAGTPVIAGVSAVPEPATAVIGLALLGVSLLSSPRRLATSRRSAGRSPSPSPSGLS